jgi:hypothetical protein
MNSAIREAFKTITVGDLISELCRWPDHALVEFRCRLVHQELRFDHIEGGPKGVVEIELASVLDSVPVAADQTLELTRVAHTTQPSFVGGPTSASPADVALAPRTA